MAQTDPDQPTSPPSPPQPGQTIFIERRPRGGWLRSLLTPILLLVLLFWLVGSFFSGDSTLLTRMGERYVAGEVGAPKVVIIDIDGAIVDSGAEATVRAIRQARDDASVRAIVLRIDSPGGTVSGSDRIWREVNLVRERNKPVVVSMAGMAASGGYYVAAPADKIFAEPTTLTGSIGVKLQMFQVGETLKKVGVEVETITTGEWKDSGSMFKPMSPAERQRWTEMLGETHQRFIRVVAQGRSLPIATVGKLATGKVFTAREALDARLIDEIGYLDDAIQHAERLARIETSHVVRYVRPLSLSETLLDLGGASSRSALPALDEPTLMRLQTPQVLLLAR